MEPKTAKNDYKRTIKDVLDISRPLCLQVHDKAPRKTDQEERHTFRGRFSLELVTRIVDRIEEL